MLSNSNSAVRLLSATGTAGDTTLVRAGGSHLYRVMGYNARGSAVYLKFYNKATAPTIGTDTPVLTFYLPTVTAFSLDCGGHYFSLGIGFGLTTAGADNSTAFVTAADILALNILVS